MFDALLAHPGVQEVLDLRGGDAGRFGFMAFHGGSLEAMTDVIAIEAARRAGASCYAVVQPAGLRWHIPSVEIDPGSSAKLAAFLAHVDVVVTVHGYGRDGFWSTLLLGGRHRVLAEHVATHLRRALPAYEIATDLDRIPKPLRGLSSRNPVNRPAGTGVQIELPPRVRGASPLWWDWEGPGVTPHTEALIEALACAATAWTDGPSPAGPHRDQGDSRSTTHDSSDAALRR